eukprot:Skav221798  [mRNA]  locus=scaffold4067:215937:228094:- [translate_table: standard]
MSCFPQELGGSTSSRARDDSTGRRSAKGSAPGSVSAFLRPEPVSPQPRRRDLSSDRRRNERNDDGATEVQRAMEKTEVQDHGDHVIGWAASAGREMASRAGAVTVRRMVETTKLLLQNLETALMLRAGFLANCYHRWHLEEELAKHARHQMTVKEKRQQQAMLIAQQSKTALQAQKAVEIEAKKLEKLLEDERRRSEALEKQSAMSAEQRKEAAKRSYVQDTKRRSRRLQGVHDAVLKSLLGEARGSAKLALMNWHSLAKDEKRVRQMEEMERVANERFLGLDELRAIRIEAPTLGTAAARQAEGEKAKLEAERERLVHLKELETKKQEEAELRALQAEVFSAWHIHGRFAAHELNHETMEVVLTPVGGDTGRSRGSSVEPRRKEPTPRSRTPRELITKGAAGAQAPAGATAPAPNKRDTSAVSSASTAPTLPRRIPRGDEDKRTVLF